MQENSAVVWTLNPPRTSSSEPREALLQLVSKGYQEVHLQGVLSKAPREINGSLNGCQALKSVDNNEFGVVSQLEGTANSLKLISGDVGELDVAVEREGLANLGQHREANRLEGVVDESNGLVDRFKLGEQNGPSITDGNVTGPNKIRERNIDVLAVKFDRKSLGNIAESNIDGLELLVIINVENTAGLQVDTIERAELGVCNQNLGALCDLCCELQSPQGRKGNPADFSDAGKLRAAQGLKNDQTLQVEVPGNGSQARSRDRYKSRSPFDV